MTIKDLTRDLAKKEHEVMEKVLEAVQMTYGKLDARTRMPKLRPFKVGDRVILKKPYIKMAQKNKPIEIGPFLSTESWERLRISSKIMITES